VNIIYPRVTSLFSSATNAVVGGVNTSVDELATSSANRILQFQKDYANYLWGIEDTSMLNTLDITSPYALPEIAKLLHPILTKANRQSGVTLALNSNNSLTKRQIRELDNLMKAYTHASAQSAPFIFQHTQVDLEAAQSTQYFKRNINTNEELMKAMVESDVVSKIYQEGVKKLKSYTNNEVIVEDTRENATKEENANLVDALYIKFYPRAIHITPPTHRASVHQLSHSKLLRVTNGKTNPLFAMNGILAFNTYDAQWVDLYTSFFDLWFSFGNNVVDVMVGDYVFKDMLFVKPPHIINTYHEAVLFDAILTSEHTNLTDFVR